MPKRPMAANCPKTSRGKAWAASMAAACGAMRSSLKRANCARISRCSGLRSKSIELLRGGRRNDLVAHLFAELGAIALARIAVATAPAGLLMVGRALGDVGDQVLVLRHDDLAVGISQADEVERARPAAEQSEGRFEVAVAEGHELRVVRADFEDGFDAEAAAPLAGTGRVA